MKKNQDYRFAFVGVTSSGKTCILGRLAQQTDADNRYSSSLVKPEGSNTNVTENDSSESEESIALKGYYKIRDAQYALDSSRCPEATQTQETGRLLVSFDMTDEERGEFRICTEDYSGELINEELLSEQTSLANELKRKLSQYDGLVFVVETLAQNDNVDQAKIYIQNLCRFFSAIKDCMSKQKWETTPLAIVFSKWDKFSHNINYNDTEAEEAKLEGYLKQYPFFNNLVKRIRAVTNTQDSLADLESENSEELSVQLSESEQENTKTFPVSAFGKSVYENGKYRPDKDAQAYGIVAPFAWMVKRLDELTLVELKKESKSWWNWFYAFGLNSRVKTALQRIPKKTPNGKALSRIKHWASFQCCVNVVIWLSLAYLIGFGSLCGVDSYKLNQYKTVVYNQSATQEQVKQAEEDVRAYANCSTRKFFQVFRSTNSLGEGIKKITDKCDEELWKGVLLPKTEAEKYEAAKHYLEIFQNGKHKEEAFIIKTEFENQQKNNEIAEIKQNVKQGKKDLAEKQCESFIKRYKSGVHVDQVQRILEVLNFEKAKQMRIFEYRALYNSNDEERLTAKLIEIIQKYSSEDEDIKKLIGEFPSIFKDVLNRKCEGKPENAIIEMYESALHTVDSLLEALNGSEIIQNLKPYLREQINKHVIAMDKSLYQAVQKSPTLTSIDNYINRMGKHGKGKMLKEVTAYKIWLLGQDEEKEYTVSIKMRWGDKTPKYKTRIKIWVDDLSMEKYNQNGIAISPNLEKNIKEVKIKKKFLTDSVYFKVEVVSEGNWTGNGKNFGAGKKTFLVSSLVSSSEFDLTPYGTVVVKIIDAPTKPQLPQWKEK